ncbi:unnamed protein product, partial [Tetraodon nigroviridis]
TLKMENDDKYLPELLAEKDSLDSSFTHAMKLLNAEIDRIQKGETKKEPESYLDLFTTKNIKLKERVLIPVKQYPKFNFVGKILGPQGNTIKRLQEETGAKISVLGKGSMRDKSKEEGLRKGGEPKYAHLSMELHVFIEVFAPVPDAYLRMAHAMEEVKKFLFPDMMDDICQEQFMELSYLNGGQEHGARGRGGMPIRGRGVLPAGAHRAMMRTTQTQPTSRTTTITVNRKQSQNTMTTDTERARKHTSPMTRVTGTVTNGRLQERPLCPPEVPRRLTESIRTNSTEADAPPLNGSPPSSSCLPWQLALSSPTKVIVRFVFGSFFSTLDFL